jgi:predicted transcriptional regulator
MSKKPEKREAITLRRRGFSYREIAEMLHVSVSSVSLWLKGESWSKDITLRNAKRAGKENSKRLLLLNKARSNQYKKLYKEAERSAETEYKHYKHHPLFIAGLMLYVGEGDNKDLRLIRIANTKFEIHSIFIRFCEEFLGVSREKIRFWVLLYPDLDPLLVSKEWSRVLSIPLSQFHKYQVIQGKSIKRTLQYGVGNTIIGSAVLKHKLMKWIELAFLELKS